MDGGAWWAAVHEVARTRLSDFTFTFHFHALEKEMATHSSVLAWTIPGTGEPDGLPSMGSHRVGHDWSDLAAAADCDSLSLLQLSRSAWTTRQSCIYSKSYKISSCKCIPQVWDTDGVLGKIIWHLHSFAGKIIWLPNCSSYNITEKKNHLIPPSHPWIEASDWRATVLSILLG